MQHNYERTGVAMDTWYPKYNDPSSGDHMRGNLALQTIAECKERGLTLAIIDGSSPSEKTEFHEKLKMMGVAYSPQTKPGMSAGRLQGYRELAENRNLAYFIRLEAEKVSLIRDCLDAILDPITSGSAGIVIPARKEVGWESLPRDQRVSEEIGNEEYNLELERRGLKQDLDLQYDFFFGPRVFNRVGLQYFLDPGFQCPSSPQFPTRRYIRLDMYDNALFLPVVRALIARRVPVAHLPVEYVHPTQQKEYEELHADELRKKRRSQVIQITNALQEVLDFLGIEKKPLPISAMP